MTHEPVCHPLADQLQRLNVSQLLDGSRVVYPDCTQLAVGLQELDRVVIHKLDLRLLLKSFDRRKYAFVDLVFQT